jgi:hypothetical protein
VYLGAIAGYLPSAMVCCFANFMSACYIARRNVISACALKWFQECVAKFHELCNIFITTGVHKSISLPCQHTLEYYYLVIQLFGSPNGLCSSIMESKHCEAVKFPCCWSSCYEVLSQILKILLQMQKLLALRHLYKSCGMLNGTTTTLYMARTTPKDTPQDATPPQDAMPVASELAAVKDGAPMPVASELAADEDGVPVEDTSEELLFIVTLSERTGACADFPFPEVLLR